MIASVDFLFTRVKAYHFTVLDPLQVQFLSSAIDLPVLQYFQKGYQDFYGRPVKDYEVVKPAGMVGSVKGQNKDCVFVLWVCESQKLYIDGGRLDYIVPVLKKVRNSVQSISYYMQFLVISAILLYYIDNSSLSIVVMKSDLGLFLAFSNST